MADTFLYVMKHLSYKTDRANDEAPIKFFVTLAVSPAVSLLVSVIYQSCIFSTLEAANYASLEIGLWLARSSPHAVLSAQYHNE